MTSTAEDLLAALREATGRPDLTFARDPEPLAGGFYAEMVRITLEDPPAGLEGGLVARIVPNPAFGAFEATVQGQVAAAGFPTPAVRLTVGEESPLGRYLIVMDLVDGRPPLEGLGLATVLGSLPSLVRGLPDQLASVAAQLHDLDPGPLVADLARLGGGVPVSAEEFVEQQVAHARMLGADDLVAAGESLLRSPPASSVRAIAHGDLHPLNLLETGGGPVLVDWTVAAIAHPAFTLSFTGLMLTHPPLPVPSAVRSALGPIARRMARRFETTYRARSADADAHLDPEAMRWHRGLHCLRILVEVAGWDSRGARPSFHPWLVLEPVARAELGLG